MTEPPALRVVAGGQPSDEDLAALTSVLALVASAAARGDEPPARSRWRGSAHPAASWTRTEWIAAARQSALRRQQ